MAAMDATVEQLEGFHEDDVEVLIVRLRKLREAKGERKPEMPDTTLERKELSETSESLFSKAKEALKTAFEYLVVKPAEWVGRQLRDHPFRTVLIALAAFALWYYSAPLSAGLSAIQEKGLGMSSALFKETLAIDPTQVNAFNALMNP